MVDRRRFSILDGMIFVIAIAMGLAWIREDNRICDGYGWQRTEGPTLSWLMLAPLTVAVFVARIKPPLPCRRKLFREPGFVACAIATFLLLSTGIFSLILAAAHGTPLWWLNYAYRIYWIPLVGPFVAAAWLLLASSGRWRSERTWVDRAGLYLGVLWIMTKFVPMCLYFWDRILPVLIQPPR